MLQTVFVYGTLKKGFANTRFNQGTHLTGEYTTLHSYPLYLVGKRYMPWLISQKGKGKKVKGEIYRVTSRQLALMDKLEGTHRRDGYQRVSLMVKASHSAKIVKAWAYVKPRQLLRKKWIRLGPLAEFDQRCNALYQPRHRGHDQQKMLPRQI